MSVLVCRGPPSVFRTTLPNIQMQEDRVGTGERGRGRSGNAGEACLPQVQEACLRCPRECIEKKVSYLVSLWHASGARGMPQVPEGVHRKEGVLPRVLVACLRCKRHASGARGSASKRWCPASCPCGVPQVQEACLRCPRECIEKVVSCLVSLWHASGARGTPQVPERGLRRANLLDLRHTSGARGVNMRLARAPEAYAPEARYMG